MDRQLRALAPPLLLTACADPQTVPWDRDPTPDLRAQAESTPALLINEVQLDNDSTVMDANLAFSDWVELFNPGPRPIAMSRVSLVRGYGSPWEGVEGGLAPGEHLLLWANGGDGPDELPWDLANEGEELTLMVDGEPLDRIATGPVPDDRAWARYPDGGAWRITALPTPGRSNGTRPPASDDPSDRLFQSERVLFMQLSLPASTRAALARDPYTEAPGSLAFEGAYFPAVAVRLKGQIGSFRTLDEKAGFKVDLNAYEDHELRGEIGLTLNNMVQDESCLHEYLAYTLYRAVGVPAPRVGWVWLEVDGEPFGLYLLVESPDERFLARWYADPSGHLYEGAYGQDFDHASIPNLEYDGGPDPDDRSALEAVADILDAGPSTAGLNRLNELVDVDEFLTNQAVEALILHWDGYTTRNNWRMYLDPVSGRFQILPWGTDQTFVDYWYWPWDGYGRVFTFCLAVPECAAAYDQRLLEVADVLDSLALEPELDPLHALLAPSIEADPRREYAPVTSLRVIEQTRTTLLTWPAEVRALVAERRAP